MTDLVLIKMADGSLVPSDVEGEEYLAKIAAGAGVTARVTKHNNVQFHRKMMKLLSFAFDCFEAPELKYKDEVVKKNFDQFRKDLTVLAGFYEAGINLKGEVRLSAKSLSFATMGQVEREQIYSAFIDVILAKVLKNYKREDLENVINELMGYDG